MRILAIIAVVALALPAFAQTGDSPRIVTERRGNTTNIVVEGQLAPTRDLRCIDVPDVRNAYTPADIQTGLKHCIADGDFDRAVRLLLVAGIFARFDAGRVADVSARHAGQVLIYQTTWTRLQSASLHCP